MSHHLLIIQFTSYIFEYSDWMICSIVCIVYNIKIVTSSVTEAISLSCTDLHNKSTQ